MMDLYALFIEQIFGGFWIAVMGIAFIMLIIMILGNVSFYTIMWFEYVFLIAMGIGYGQALISVTISIIIFAIFLFQVKGYVDRGAGVS
jgi:uncharacterized membrane protein YcaP (DUF421 family)